MTKRYEVVAPYDHRYVRDRETGAYVSREEVYKLACAALNAGLTAEAIEEAKLFEGVHDENEDEYYGPSLVIPLGDQ